MDIYFASHFDVDNHHGYVMAISNTQPKTMPRRDVFCELLPGDLAWKVKNQEITWEQYKEQYLGNLEELTSIICDELYRLEKSHEKITLCCWEKDPQQCHRSFVFEFLMKQGFVCNLA
jgi:uncharacterized protein YeaO (DUF488 family)